MVIEWATVYSQILQKCINDSQDDLTKNAKKKQLLVYVTSVVGFTKISHWVYVTFNFFPQKETTYQKFQISLHNIIARIKEHRAGPVWGPPWAREKYTMPCFYIVGKVTVRCV